jgi:hypothetical protein
MTTSIISANAGILAETPSIASVAMTGRSVMREICRRDGQRFVSTTP